MILDYLRLAVATGLVLLPGKLVARALGQRTLASTVAWTMAALTVAWALVFTLHGSILYAVLVLAAIASVAFGVGGRRRPERPPMLRSAVAAVGVLLGLALWHVEGAVVGDGLFHEARVRKLVDLGHPQPTGPSSWSASGTRTSGSSSRRISASVQGTTPACGWRAGGTGSS